MLLELDALATNLIRWCQMARYTRGGEASNSYLSPYLSEEGQLLANQSNVGFQTVKVRLKVR